MNKPIYFIKEFWNKADSHKFQTKIEFHFAAQHFIAIEYPKQNIYKRITFIIQLLISIPVDSTIFFQYPLFSKTNQLILKILKIKNVNPICIVTDLDSIRDKQNIDEEFTILNQYDDFILQNQAMKKLFLEKLTDKKYATIDLFDIHYSPEKITRTKNNEIVFAGNIAKAPFVLELNKINHLQFNIYTQHQNKQNNNVQFHFVDDQQIDKTNLKGSFGLVWDGEFLDNITCPFGEYLKYVTPLKLSKYILAGLPIIIHQDAAMANFVTENKIGFCISSIYAIEEKINSLSENDYQQMIENLKPIEKNIRAGFYLHTAIENIINIH